MCNNVNPPKEIVNHLKTLLNNGKFSDAYEKVKTVIKQHPKSFILWNILGVSLYELKKIEDAIKSYEKAVSFNEKTFLVFSSYLKNCVFLCSPGIPLLAPPPPTPTKKAEYQCHN